MEPPLLLALGWLLGFVPRRWLGNAGAALGSLAQVLGVRRQVVRANLVLAFPQLSDGQRAAIAKASYRRAGRSALEVFAVPRLSPAQLEQLIEHPGQELVARLLSEGRGLVVATAHLGSWELLAAAMARQGVRLNVVTRALRGGANRALQRARARSGVVELPPRGALARGGAALRRGEVVVNLLDQNMLPKRGVFVRFFGAWACTTPAASLLSLRSGAPVVVAIAEALPGGRMCLRVDGPFPIAGTGPRAARVRAHTQVLVAAIERHVRADPGQWFWLHRRWKTQPLVPPEEIQSMAPPNPSPGR